MCLKSCSSLGVGFVKCLKSASGIVLRVVFVAAVFNRCSGCPFVCVG